MATLASSAFLAVHKPSLFFDQPSMSKRSPPKPRLCQLLNWDKRQGLRRLRSAEEETLAPEQEEAEGEGETASLSEQQAVSLPHSHHVLSDGTMSEAAIPTVIKALEETEGVSNLKVPVVEGIASVELEKLNSASDRSGFQLG